MKEFEICRQRTPEEHQAVQEAVVRRYLAEIDRQIREIAGQHMAYGRAYFVIGPESREADK